MDVLLDSLTPANFPDLFTLLWVAALVIVVGAVVVYSNSARRFRRYPVLLSLHEWLFWPVVIPWGLVLLLVITGAPLLLLLLIVVPGLAVMLWARFVRFPPLIAAANEELRRRRFVPRAEVRPRARPVGGGGPRRRGRGGRR